jgi:hypothetical protein
MKLPLALVLALLTTPAFASGLLPDGTYECMMDSYIAGNMEIAGTTYQGPAFDGAYEGTYEFEIDPPTGNITWHGPVGGYTQPGIQLIGSMLVDVGNGVPGIQMQVRNDGSDNIHFVVCTPSA